MKKLAIAVLSLIFLATVPLIAHADTIGTIGTFTLTNGGSCCSPGPFGTITLTQTAAGVVTVMETLAPNEYFVGTGAGDSLGFNVKPADGALTIGNITAGFHNVGSDSLSPFGSFLEAVTCDDPASCHGGQTSNIVGPLSFTVTSALGVNVSDFIVNGGGYYFASDIFLGNITTGVGNTGNVASIGGTFTTPTPTPEPSSLMLLGTGIVGGVGMMRRKILSALANR
ncbi:MAG TPA: PEP-CTERM sorting domain-containing protein [Acidobacteriaceae bacterium]|jgi:hypothetical protein